MEATRRYDVEMIRDFLEHLEWEYRIARAENTHIKDSSENHAELVDALLQFQERRGPCILLPPNILKPDGETPQRREEATRILRQNNARNAENVIELLEAMRPTLELALNTIKTCYEQGPPAFNWTVAEILEMPDDDVDEDEE